MKQVLIIEDDKILRENTAELLVLSGYKVITAANGQKGIDLAIEQEPDVIICDIMMPKMDGYEVLESLMAYENTRFIPFIFLSAKTKHDEIRKGMDLGADDYLTKPFFEEDLLKSIEGRLRKVELFKQQPSSKKSSSTISPQYSEEQFKDLNQLKVFFTEEGQTKHYKKGELLFQKGDRSNHIYLLLEGLVKTHIIDRQGKELITGLYKPNDLLGFTSFNTSVPFAESATTLKTTVCIQLSKSYLLDLLQDHQEVSVELMNLLSANLSDIKKQLMRMAYSSVRKKTAATIIKFAKLMDENPEMAIRISRSDLAAQAGIAPESLIRTLSDFKKRELIEIEGRTIRIKNLEGLQTID